MQKDMIICPISGLCNRLRVIFTYYPIAKKENKKLRVLWYFDEECPGYFDDYFDPIGDIIIIRIKQADISSYPEKIDYKGYGIHPVINANTLYMYSELKLKKEIHEKVINNINVLKDYVAIHVRRTDHMDLANCMGGYTKDNEFFEFLDKTDKNIYLATDNKNTQDVFLAKYKDRIKCLVPINDINALRKTTLEMAIVDLFTCIYAKDFKGSHYSSFSEFIRHVRQANIII